MQKNYQFYRIHRYVFQYFFFKHYVNIFFSLNELFFKNNLHIFVFLSEVESTLVNCLINFRISSEVFDLLSFSIISESKF